MRPSVAKRALGDPPARWIRERVKAGLHLAKLKGVTLGRPVASAKSDEAIELKQQGLSLSQIGKRLGCSRSTVKRRLKETVTTP
jgi:DNA invertase Pin-like site-specific DNA recombinase